MIQNPINIVSKLRKESKEWIKTLTDEEQHAIAKYTLNSVDKKSFNIPFYKRLNSMLRKDAEYKDFEMDTEMLEHYSAIISNAIKKYKLKQLVVCYRGVEINPIEDYEIGDIIQMKQFISTSVIETRIFPGQYKMVIYAPVGACAAYIEKLSFFPKQREMLFDKDCYYEIVSNENNVIELEVRI